MGTQTGTEKHKGRGIHNEKFYKSLTEGKLNKMIAIILNDEDLDVQIRNNYLNIYYEGGSIAKVNSENSVVFDKFYYYLEMKEVSKKIIEQDKDKCELLLNKKNSLTDNFKNGNFEHYFKEAKVVIDKWLKLNPKPERMEQHKLSIENQYKKSDYTIIDLEYQVSIKSDFVCKINGDVKKPRFDIIAIDKKGKLCVIEFKKGLGALKGKSGLKDHWECYTNSIGGNTKPFMDEMRLILNQKQELKLIDKELKIIDPEPKFMFAYSYSYDGINLESEQEQQQDKGFNVELKNINAPIEVLKLKKGIFKLKD